MVVAKYPLKHRPGALVQVVGKEYPPNSGKVSLRLGLYAEPGYPMLAGVPNGPTTDERLHERLCGSLDNGNLCLVVAVKCHPDDGKWYYLLRRIGIEKGFGWTRVGFRLESAG